MYLGDYAADSTVEFKWNTRGADGASITRTTDGSIRIYKDNSATQRSSSAGITDTEDFDTLTGVHHCQIDLSDNTNRWGAHPDAMAVVRGADDELLTRYPDVYARDLRAAIQRRYGVPADAIATGCGSDDVLDSAFRAAGPEGGVVAYPGPTFSMVDPFARMNGRVGVEVPWSRAMADPTSLLERDPVPRHPG